MVLILEVTGPQGAQLGSASRKVFGVEGGLIGRDSRNAWVLPHTKVSGRHARIIHQNGVFYIEDTSTNGVFMNGSRSRVGKGRTFALQSGDTIFIDPYKITVAVSTGDYGESAGRRYPPPAASPRTPPPQVDPFAGDDPFGEQAVPFGERLVPGVEDPRGEPMAGHEVDPLKLLGGQDPVRRQPPRKVPSAQDLERGSPLHGHYQPPRVMTPTPPPAPTPPDDPFAIPEDYDPLAPATKYRLGSTPDSPKPASAHPPRPPEPESTPLDLDDFPPVAERVSNPTTDERVVEPESSAPVPHSHERTTPAPSPAPLRSATPPPVAPAGVRHTPSSTPSPADLSAPPARATPGDLAVDLRAVLEGAGLDPEDLTADLARDLGKILRVVVAGLMEVLQARHNVKDEFRMRVTQFQRADNNPLKFSANVDDALHNLLVKRNPAYLRPVDAFDDAFDDLRYHQLAMLAGMRTAFETMLQEFHPERLQGQFDRQNKRGALLAVASKLRYWDFYCDMHDELSKDPDVTFRKLFGDAFAKAYEEQLRRLKAQHPRADSGKPPDEPDM